MENGVVCNLSGGEIMKKIGKFIASVLIVFGLPLIITYIVLIGIRMNNLKPILLLDILKPIDIGDYIYLIVTIVGVLVTGYFSYKLYYLSKENSEHEKKKQINEVKKSARYLYVDLKMKIDSAIRIFETDINENLKLHSNDFEDEMEARKAYITYKSVSDSSDDWKIHLSTVEEYLPNRENTFQYIIDLYSYFVKAQTYADEGNIRACVISLNMAKILSDDFKAVWNNSDTNWQNYIDIRNTDYEEMKKNADMMTCINNSKGIEAKFRTFYENDLLNYEKLHSESVKALFNALKDITRGDFIH